MSKFTVATATTAATEMGLFADPASAAEVAVMVVNQIKAEGSKYRAYIEANHVEADAIADHVKALRELAYPGVKSSGKADADPIQREAKRFADKVRNGLKWALNVEPTTAAGTQNLLTADGVTKLADLDDAAILAAVRAELAARLSAE